MMFYELDKKLRRIFFAIIAIATILKLTEKKEETVDDQDGFQTKKFDDIW